MPTLLPHNLSEVTAEQWRAYYLYAMTRLVTACTVFSDLLSDARGPRRLPAISPLRRREFHDRLVEELGWTQTVYQFAVATNPRGLIHSPKTLFALTRVITHPQHLADRMEYVQAVTAAGDQAFLKFDFNAKTWWDHYPHPTGFQNIDEFIASYEHDKHLLGRLFTLDKKELSIYDRFKAEECNEGLAKGVCYELGAGRNLSELSYVMVETRMAEVHAKLHKLQQQIEESGCRLVTRNQDDLLRAIHRGECDNEIDTVQE